MTKKHYIVLAAIILLTIGAFYFVNKPQTFGAISTINKTDTGSTSLAKINANFASLQSDLTSHNHNTFYDVLGQATGTLAIHNAAYNHPNYDTAFSWGNHSGLYDILGQATSTLSIHTSTYNHSNYNTAYSWGNHAGLYDNLGQATSTLSVHTAAYNHANYNSSYSSLFGTGTAGMVLSTDGSIPYWRATSTLGFSATGGTGSGTVNSGTAGQLAWYASAGTAVSGTSSLYMGGTSVLSDSINVYNGNDLNLYDVGSGYRAYLSYYNENLLVYSPEGVNIQADYADLSLTSYNGAIYIVADDFVSVEGMLMASSSLLVDGSATINDNLTSTTTIQYGDTDSGTNKARLCVWNGSNFTIIQFGTNSITPNYSTSTTCNL